MRAAYLAAGFFICARLVFAAEPIKDGFYDERDRQGHLKRTVEYQYGKPHGRFRTFYPDGRIDGAGTYLNGWSHRSRPHV